mgnify:CR=1 FL=1
MRIISTLLLPTGSVSVFVHVPLSLSRTLGALLPEQKKKFCRPPVLLSIQETVNRIAAGPLQCRAAEENLPCR